MARVIIDDMQNYTLGVGRGQDECIVVHVAVTHSGTIERLRGFVEARRFPERREARFSFTQTYFPSSFEVLVCSHNTCPSWKKIGSFTTVNLLFLSFIRMSKRLCYCQ